MAGHPSLWHAQHPANGDLIVSQQCIFASRDFCQFSHRQVLASFDNLTQLAQASSVKRIDARWLVLVFSLLEQLFELWPSQTALPG